MGHHSNNKKQIKNEGYYTSILLQENQPLVMKRYRILFHEILDLKKIAKRLRKKRLLNPVTSYSRWKNGRPERLTDA